MKHLSIMTMLSLVVLGCQPETTGPCNTNSDCAANEVCGADGVCFARDSGGEGEGEGEGEGPLDLTPVIVEQGVRVGAGTSRGTIFRVRHHLPVTSTKPARAGALTITTRF